MAVVGAGPAGLAATAALSRAGLRVASISPEHPPQWPNTYGIWADELQGVGLSGCARRLWEDVRVFTGSSSSAPGEKRLERHYALVDNERLRRRLMGRAETGEVTWIEGVVREATARGSGVRLRTRGGRTVEACIGIDATGHQPTLVDRPSCNPAYQTAYGVTVECAGVPFDPETMVLMDYRPSGAARRGEGPPTFLYAMPLGEGRWFFEETVLVARPAVPFDPLERALLSRIERLGVEVREIRGAERVRIPMGLSLPTPHDRLVAFGGAASMVHPASGYMLGRTLIEAEHLARTVADVIERGRPPGRIASRAREAVWPRRRRRARELCLFGMETLLRMDAPQTRRFFESFFSLPVEEWAAFLSGRAAPRTIAATMWRIFARVDGGLKRQLARTVFSGSSSHLLRGLI